MRYVALIALLSLVPLTAVAVIDDAPAGPSDVKFHGTMKQIIGMFSTYGHVKVGDELDLDFGRLPVEKISLTRPDADPNRGVAPYIPFQAPLQVTKHDPGDPKIGGSLVILTSTDVNSKLVLQLWARELKPGTAAKLYFYEEAFGRIRCMAEAEGVLQ